jgi:hypothetical protein
MIEGLGRNATLRRPTMPRTGGSLGKIWRRSAVAAVLIYSVMNWCQYKAADRDLSAMDEDRSAAVAANDVDNWKDEPFYWKAAF